MSSIDLLHIVAQEENLAGFKLNQSCQQWSLPHIILGPGLISPSKPQQSCYS
jgi:hypothetical protein